MKNKQTLTLEQAKRNMIKSGLFAGAAVLVLIVASVAWFSSGTKVDVDNVNASIENALSSTFYQSVDTDKDGIIDAVPNWTPVTDPAIDTGVMVPGQNMFYKIVASTAKPNLKLKLSGISPVVPSGGTMDKEDVLSLVNIKIEARDQSNNLITGSTDFDGSMFELLGSNPDATEVTVYDLDMTSYYAQQITIYYTVGLPSSLLETDLQQGAGVNIGNIELIAS